MHDFWRGAGVAYLARLESVCTRKGTEGSNPSLSATEKGLNNFLYK
jgi:hypothetical protein